MFASSLSKPSTNAWATAMCTRNARTNHLLFLLCWRVKVRCAMWYSPLVPGCNHLFAPDPTIVWDFIMVERSVFFIGWAIKHANGTPYGILIHFWFYDALSQSIGRFKRTSRWFYFVVCKLSILCTSNSLQVIQTVVVLHPIIDVVDSFQGGIPPWKLAYTILWARNVRQISPSD